jgi:hypothetical protein
MDHRELLAWLAEAKRLFVEAEERLEEGKVLPAFSSLVAVRPLHRMLMDRCSELLNEIDGPPITEPSPSIGMYL